MIVVFFSCSPHHRPLEGMWDITNNIYYVSDTFEIEDIVEPFGMERITVRTDSGIYKISHIDDSIIDIGLSRQIQVLEFQFENKNEGKLSQYDLNIDERQNEGSGLNSGFSSNFSLYNSNGHSYLLFQNCTDEFRSKVDTIEYLMIFPDALIIFGDTLERVKL